MLSLVEHHMGFDAAALGFPSVHSCHALVYQTRQGLYGVHHFGGADPAQMKPRAEAFAAFVQAHNINHKLHALKLYSAITRTNRYDDTAAGNALWLSELKETANALRFTGEVMRTRLKEHIEVNGSAYVRFDVKGDSCVIRYKRWSRMDLTPDKADLAPDSTLALMRPTTTAANAERGLYSYRVELKDERVKRVFRKGTTPAPGDPNPDEGDMHTASGGDLEIIKIY